MQLTQILPYLPRFYTIYPANPYFKQLTQILPSLPIFFLVYPQIIQFTRLTQIFPSLPRFGRQPHLQAPIPTARALVALEVLPRVAGVRVEGPVGGLLRPDALHPVERRAMVTARSWGRGREL